MDDVRYQLRAIIKAQKIRQKTVAATVGITEKHMSQIMLGRIALKHDQWAKIADAVGYRLVVGLEPKGDQYVDLMRPAPGYARCSICFEARRYEDLLLEEATGQRWDICGDGNCAEQAGLHPDGTPRERVEQ